MSIGTVYKVTRAHYAVLDDELSVKPGDSITVHAMYDDGWLNASIVGTSVQGMVCLFIHVSINIPRFLQRVLFANVMKSYK